VKLGLDDLTSALAATNGRCLFGFGEARGQNRGTEALKKALKSPLIDQGRLLHQTRTLLVHVAGGESLTLVEVEGVMKQLGRHVPDQTHILFGLGVDAKLGDAIAITLISSLGLSQLNAHATAAPPSEMLQPRAEAAPAPRREAPVKKAVAPPPVIAEPVADLLFKSEEITAPAAPPAVEAVESVREPETEPVFEDEEPEFVDDAEFEAEQPAPPDIAPTPETARIPVRTPVARELAEAARAKESTLATVVARSVTLQTESAPPQDDLITFDNTPPPPTTTIHATTIVSRKPASDPQQTFSLGEEDRGRFKDTEPSIVQGEDLDVPTWMRLKKKLRR